MSDVEKIQLGDLAPGGVAVAGAGLPGESAERIEGLAQVVSRSTLVDTSLGEHAVEIAVTRGLRHRLLGLQ